MLEDYEPVQDYRAMVIWNLNPGVSVTEVNTDTITGVGDNEAKAAELVVHVPGLVSTGGEGTLTPVDDGVKVEVGMTNNLTDLVSAVGDSTPFGQYGGLPLGDTGPSDATPQLYIKMSYLEPPMIKVSSDTGDDLPVQASISIQVPPEESGEEGDTFQALTGLEPYLAKPIHKYSVDIGGVNVELDSPMMATFGGESQMDQLVVDDSTVESGLTLQLKSDVEMVDSTFHSRWEVAGPVLLGLFLLSLGRW